MPVWGEVESESKKDSRECTSKLGSKGCIGLFSHNKNSFNFYDYKIHRNSKQHKMV